jgi:hypothetical protein
LQTSDVNPRKNDLMKKTYIDVLLELSVDGTLLDFLTSHGLPVPDGFAWDDTDETSQSLIEAIDTWPDTTTRDRMIANLMASVQLGDPAGTQAMFDTVASDGTARAGLMLCRSDVHRSFWLYVTHPTLFERADDFSFWEQHGAQTQQYAVARTVGRWPLKPPIVRRWPWMRNGCARRCASRSASEAATASMIWATACGDWVMPGAHPSCSPVI